MTVAETVAKATASLPPDDQQEVLDFVEFLRARKSKATKLRPRKPVSSNSKKRHPAVRAIAGIWKDRTDLPKDAIEAVKVLRSRMRSRGRNG